MSTALDTLEVYIMCNFTRTNHVEYIAGKIIKGLVSLITLSIYYLLVHAFFFCSRTQGFRPEGEIPRMHPSSSRVYIEKYLQLKYTAS